LQYPRKEKRQYLSRISKKRMYMSLFYYKKLIAFSLISLFSFTLDALTVGTTFTAQNMYDAPTTSLNPPSGQGAVGASQIVVASVFGVTSFNRSGQKDYQLDTSLNSMVSDASNTVLDALNPQIRFDSLSKRWFVVASNFDPDTGTGCPGHIYIAVSSSDVITRTTTWRVVDLLQENIAPTGDAGAGILDPNSDYITLGIDAHALYIGINLYDCGTENFISSAVFVVQKASLLGTDPVVATAFRGLSSSNIISPVGVDNFDANPTFGYVIGNNSTLEGELILYRIINPGSTTPTISSPVSITVAQTAPPVDALFNNQFGNLVTMRMIDNRLQASHVRNGQLFTVRHIGVDQNGLSAGGEDRTGDRWTQLNLAAGGTEIATTVPTVVKEGTLYDNSAFGDSTLFYYFPSIMTTAGNNTMALAGSVSSLNTFVSGFAANRAVSAAVDNTALRNSVQIIAPGVAQYTVDAGFTTSETWGMYSKIALDPVDQTKVWPFVEFVQNYDAWGIGVASLQG
jgi:hypothetical protein